MKLTCCPGCVFWKLKTALMEKVKVKDFPTDINPPFVLQSYWVTTATSSVAKIKKRGQKLSQLKDLSHNCIWREHLELVKHEKKSPADLLITVYFIIIVKAKLEDTQRNTHYSICFVATKTQAFSTNHILWLSEVLLCNYLGFQSLS